MKGFAYLVAAILVISGIVGFFAHADTVNCAVAFISGIVLGIIVKADVLAT